jgi:hypothetical protein
MKTATSLRQTLITLSLGATAAVFALLVPLTPLATALGLGGLTGTATAAGSQSFQISPPTSNYAGNPGEQIKGTMKVTNLTGDPLSVRTGRENFVAKGEEGEIELVDNADPLYSLSPWFSFDAAQIDLPARGTKELHYTIAIPINAEPGGRYGSITYSSIPPKLPAGQSGASVQQTLAGIVFLRINGVAKEQVSVESFAADKSFYEYGPVKFLTRVKNTGNVHEKVTGTITIKNMLGMKVASVPLDEHFVIPGAIRRLHNDWPTGKNKPFLLGHYTAQLDGKYADGKTVTATTSFTVIPWKPIAVGTVILIILILLLWKGRKRFARAFRILAGKE